MLKPLNMTNKKRLTAFLELFRTLFLIVDLLVSITRPRYRCCLAGQQNRSRPSCTQTDARRGKLADLDVELSETQHQLTDL